MRRANVELRRIAGEISEGSKQVAAAARQVSTSSQALAQSASEQAASLEETSASAEELSAMTQQNAEGASTAATETENADHLLKETGQKLDQMISSMKEINTSSEKISKIIRVIDEIAFQTNILALNAAVEAARAGEAGMGFAVVADEVRNLAQRCAQAAKDTSDLIEESIVRSNQGRSRLDEVAGCVARVVDNSSKIRDLANGVRQGSQEQSRGIVQISRAVNEMQRVTQATAASAEQSAAVGGEMTAQARQLQESVELLRSMAG
jgi:methyl-accepting chemotaxis protein